VVILILHILVHIDVRWEIGKQESPGMSVAMKTEKRRSSEEEK
jgi:hypothetical protein